jgi:hypothetical protein
LASSAVSRESDSAQLATKFAPLRPISMKISSGKRYIDGGGERGNQADHKKTAHLVLRQRQGQEPSFFLEAGGGAETAGADQHRLALADWHEKERPKRRRRRNVLPDAYRRLPKQDKRQVRAAAKWIFKRVSLLDWGRKMPDEKAGKSVPKPVNLKDQVLPYIQGNWGSWVRNLTLTAIIRHLVGDDTAYFTASPGDGAFFVEGGI